MSTSIEPAILKKLTLVKQLYQKALVNSKHHSNIDKIMAVIGFDLSNETVLNLIVGFMDPTKTKANDFPGILNQVDLIFQTKNIDSIPDRGNIVNVHRIRNGAQHEARHPNDSEISDCETYTRDFLKKIINLVWNIDFEKISTVSLVRDDYCKKHLEDAEILYQNGNYKESAQKAITSLQHAINYVTNAVTGRDPSFEKLAGLDFRGNVIEARGYQGVINKMRETLLFNSLNIDITEFIKIKKITGQASWSIGSDEPHSFFNGQEVVNQNDAEYVITYCTDACILIEEKVGDIEKPFNDESIF